MSMTDEQIIEALECCASGTGCDTCRRCPFYEDKLCDKDRFALEKHLLDLIKRQQEEIERLKQTPKCVFSYDGETLEYCVEGPCSAEKTIETIRAEAVREFAEKLKKWKYQSSDWSHGEHPFVVEETDIDDLVIEMTEKEEAEKPSSDDDFEARDILQDILEEEELERHIEEMLMDAIEEGADNA